MICAELVASGTGAVMACFVLAQTHLVTKSQIYCFGQKLFLGRSFQSFVFLAYLPPQSILGRVTELFVCTLHDLYIHLKSILPQLKPSSQPASCLKKV